VIGNREGRVTVALALASILVAGAALAAPRKKAKAPRPPRAAAVTAEAGGKAVSDLASEQDDVAMAAAKKLGESPAGLEPLMAALAVGLHPTVAAEALAALGKLKDGRAFPVLAAYSGNFNAAVRLAAVKGLGGLRDPKVVDIMLERLGDPDGSVRAAAADALGARKEKRAEKRLFLLVARNDSGAAGPLGAVMAVDAVPRLAELKGRVDDAVLANAFGELLKRPDVPDRLRVDVVRTVGRLTGPAATAALVEYLASIPDSDRRPSKEEAQKLVDQKGTK
jgi:HEAT repeat protein